MLQVVRREVVPNQSRLIKILRKTLARRLTSVHKGSLRFREIMGTYVGHNNTTIALLEKIIYDVQPRSGIQYLIPTPLCDFFFSVVHERRVAGD